MSSNTQKRDSWQDILRALSYWHICILSFSAVAFVGLIVGVVAFFPLVLQRIAEEAIAQNPDSPIAEISMAIVSILPYLILIMLGLRGLVSVLRYLSTSTETKDPHHG